jgi:hypothetical protein
MTDLATDTVLRLVSGSDKVPERREEFLDAAMALNSWIGEEDDQRAPYLVNRLQIIARRRALTSDERDLLRTQARQRL